MTAPSQASLRAKLTRIFDRVIINEATECWEWSGGFNKRSEPYGYGRVKFCGRQIMVHRFMYQFFGGEIPPGRELDHLCRNHQCCNPAHLELVTHAENMARGAWAMRTHCPQGHEYTTANTYLSRRGDGTRFRQCRTCLREWHRRRRSCGGV